MESYLIILFFFITAVSSGIFLWCHFLVKKAISIIDLVIALVIGSITNSIFLFLLAVILGKLIPAVNFAILLIILTLTLYKNIRLVTFKFPRFSKKNLFVFVFYSLIVFYFYSVFSRLLFYEQGNLMAGWITVWGDWQAHLTYTTSFAYGQNFPPELPIFAGHVFSYPFLADFLSAVLTNLGMNLAYSLMLPSFIFTSCAFMLFSYLVFVLTKKILTAIVSTLLFFNNGGLGFIYIFFLGVNSTEFTKIPKENIEWMSVMTSQFIPQRGFNFAFPLALIILILLYQIYAGKHHIKLFFFTGFLISLLPLVHMHSFLILMFISGFLFLNKAKYLKGWLVFSLPVFLLAFPVIWHFYSGNSMISHFRFHLGWLAKTPAEVLPFLFKNFGLMLFLPLFGLLISQRRVKIASIPFWFVFLAANLFIFQPWDWDNTKFFVYWYVAVSILAGIFLEKFLTSKYPLISILTIYLFTIIIFSGFTDNLNLLKINKNKLRMFSAEQIEVAQYIKKNTPPKSIFLTSDNHDNLVPVLTGRKNIMGYPGWLWSYGLNYLSRQDEVKLMKTGSSQSPALFKKYQVDYVIIGPVERTQGFNQNTFESNYPKIFSSQEYTIYDTKQ